MELRPGVVVKYDFEGNTNDSVSKKNAVAVGSPTYAHGHNNGKAIQFDGLQDYLMLPTNVGLY